MLTFLLVLQALVGAVLVGVILMQRSEGGGLGMGGSPTGLMSARGAADFLTRSTAVLAAIFVGLSIVQAVLAAGGGSTAIDTSLARKPGTVQPAPAPSVPLAADPLAGAADQAGNGIAPVAPVAGPPVPLATRAPEKAEVRPEAPRPSQARPASTPAPKVEPVSPAAQTATPVPTAVVPTPAPSVPEGNSN